MTFMTFQHVYTCTLPLFCLESQFYALLNVPIPLPFSRVTNWPSSYMELGLAKDHSSSYERNGRRRRRLCWEEKGLTFLCSIENAEFVVLCKHDFSPSPLEKSGYFIVPENLNIY